MKTNLNFTRGEYVAALTILMIIMGSYLFYYLFDAHHQSAVDSTERADEFVAFAKEQQRLQDSVYSARSRQWEHHRPCLSYDTFPKGSYPPKKPMYEIVRLDLNHCDTDEVKTVPQFGSKRAAALVAYRDKLGGFYDLSQLKEVFSLQNIEADFLAKYFYVHSSDVQKININTATYQDLVRHPYFDAYLTKMILNYRQKNGKISSFEELQRVTHAYPELMERLRHYVVF